MRSLIPVTGYSNDNTAYSLTKDLVVLGYYPANNGDAIDFLKFAADRKDEKLRLWAGAIGESRQTAYCVFGPLDLVCLYEEREICKEELGSRLGAVFDMSNTIDYGNDGSLYAICWGSKGEGEPK